MSMSRRPSAYNVYVKENKDQFNSINDWAVSWKNLTEEEKQEYRVKAQNIETNQKCKEKCLKKRLRCVMKDMQNLGIDVAAIYKNLDGEVEVCGDGKIASVLLQDTNILTQVNSKQKETPSDVTTVRKKAQEHMNNLYSNAVGKKHQFPYGKVKRQELYVNGFLSDLLPIRPMSDYGMSNLRRILEIEKLELTKYRSSTSSSFSSTRAGTYTSAITCTFHQFAAIT